MREILFKAKREDNGEWLEGDLLHPDEEAGCGYCIEELDKSKKNCCPEVDPETVCQYTGRKDRKEKKIWEWDIVRSIYWLGNIKEWVVEHKDGCMVLKQIGVDYYAPLSDFNDKVEEIEVIGNIFDNPELMEVAENE